MGFDLLDELHPALWEAFERVIAQRIDMRRPGTEEAAQLTVEPMGGYSFLQEVITLLRRHGWQEQCPSEHHWSFIKGGWACYINWSRCTVTYVSP